MKSSTQESYFSRIERVVEYIGEQVDNTPSLETLAGIAAISPFHFHRVYRAATGETPSGTLRRLRLAKACILLSDAGNSITQVAFDVGYDSSQSFAKAFRARTGSSPTKIRKNPVALKETLTLLSKPADTPDTGFGKITVNVVSVDPFKVIASRHVGPQEGLFETYGELFSWANEMHLVQNLQGIYGIPLDDPRDTPAREYRFDCGFNFGTDAIDGSGMRAAELGGGTYAVTRHLGPYEGLDDKHDYLFGTWLNRSEYRLRERPLFHHYLQDPDSVPPEKWETDIYVPIEKAVQRGIL